MKFPDSLLHHRKQPLWQSNAIERYHGLEAVTECDPWCRQGTVRAGRWLRRAIDDLPF